jgi:hypothetical protein
MIVVFLKKSFNYINVTKCYLAKPPTPSIKYIDTKKAPFLRTELLLLWINGITRKSYELIACRLQLVQVHTKGLWG